MLKPLGESAGLGSLPDPFYTNYAESSNHILSSMKQITKHLSGLNFANCMAKELIEEQANEF